VKLWQHCSVILSVISQSVFQYVCLSVISQSLCLLVCLSVYQSSVSYQSVCLSVISQCLSVSHQSVCLSVISQSGCQSVQYMNYELMWHVLVREFNLLSVVRVVVYNVAFTRSSVCDLTHSLTGTRVEIRVALAATWSFRLLQWSSLSCFSVPLLRACPHNAPQATEVAAYSDGSPPDAIVAQRTALCATRCGPVTAKLAG